MSGRDISRRELLRRGIALAGAAGLGSLAAACGDRSQAVGVATEPSAPPFTGTLRVLGLSLDLNDLVQRSAQRNLPFKVSFDATTPSAMVERAVSEPGSFDLYSGYADQIDLVWPSGSLAGLDRARIDHWYEITDLYRLGKFTLGSASCTVGDGDAPFRKLYTTTVGEAGEIVQWGRDDGSGPASGVIEPSVVTGVPSTFALESVGYRHDVLDSDPEGVSWTELLNQRWQGRVALPGDPGAGLQTAALAARSLGLMPVGDIGNMTRPEIDRLARILLDLKRKGQFRAFWGTFDESVDLMASEQVVVQPMSWPAVSLLQSSGYPVHYAAPAEGYRGLAGLLSVSKAAAGNPSRLQACYDYLNWWHSGVPGAILMHYGYYNAVPGTTRDFVSPDEWDYWMDGQPAAGDLDSPFLQRSIKQGQVRDGGSLAARACRIAAWLSHFDDQSEYAAARWNEVVSA